MNFKERHLLEEAMGNKRRYLAGGLMGAGLTAASHIMGDGDTPSALDNMQDAQQDGNLWNHLVGKGQEGLGLFKGDSPSGINHGSGVSSVVNGPNSVDSMGTNLGGSTSGNYHSLYGQSQHNVSNDSLSDYNQSDYNPHNHGNMSGDAKR